MNASVIEHGPVAQTPLQPRRLAQRALTLLVDTDVLIWHLRGYPQATRRLDSLPALKMSAVSYTKLLQGMRGSAGRPDNHAGATRRRHLAVDPCHQGHHPAGHGLDGSHGAQPRAADGRCTGGRNPA